MPTLGQIKWRVRGIARRLRFDRRTRLERLRPSLSVVVVAGLAATASVVTMLTLDLDKSDKVPNSEPHLGQASHAGQKPSVVDGDTVYWEGRRVRLVGFDTPETGSRARCQSERAKGDKATSRLRDLVASGNVALVLVRCACPSGTEGTQACNYGRACGVLTINGRDPGNILIAEGLARPYQCHQFSCPPRGSWC